MNNSGAQSPPPKKSPRQPVTPRTPSSSDYPVARPSIGIDLPPIDIGPPDLEDLPPLDLPGGEPPEFHHGEEREDGPELGDPREELDPEDFEPPEDDSENGGGGGGGGGGARIGGGGGGG